MSIVSNIYLIVFLPLFSSLLCQLFNKKFLPFYITIFSCIVLFFFASRAFIDVLQYKNISNDFELGLFSIALEFRISLLSALFLLIMIFTKTFLLLFYCRDLEKFFADSDKKFFFSSYLISIFALVGAFLSNNLFNLFLFLEIYSISIFTISTLSKDKEIIKSYFEYFYYNAALSFLLLLSFFSIYLVLGDYRFDEISKNIVKIENKDFLAIIFILILMSFIGKFFFSQIFLAKKSNNDFLAKFSATDFLFNKINLGIFLILKVTFEVFNQLSIEKTIVAPFIFILSFIIILYFSLKIIKENNLKNASIYFCLSNLILIFSCIFIQTKESFQSLFFFILNFSLVNFTVFIFSSFLEKNFGNSDIENIKLLKNKHSYLALSFKLLLFFVISFPFTTSFFGFLYLTNSAFEISPKILLVMSLLIINFSQLFFTFKIINSFFSKNLDEEINAKIVISRFNFQALLLIFLVIINFIPIVFFAVTNDISLNFASHLI